MTAAPQNVPGVVDDLAPGRWYVLVRVDRSAICVWSMQTSTAVTVRTEFADLGDCHAFGPYPSDAAAAAHDDCRQAIMRAIQEADGTQERTVSA